MMADPQGDDQVVATANHILRTLSSSQADEMMKILSSFDNRFSRFSMSSAPSSAAPPRGRDSPCPEQGDGKDSKALEKISLPPALEAALEIIFRWDLKSDQSLSSQQQQQQQQPATFLWSEDRKEARQYLDAVDRLQTFIESIAKSHPHSSSSPLPPELAMAYNALQLAMLRLEAEFFHILGQHCEPSDPESLFEFVSGRSSFDAGFSFSFSSSNSSRRIGEEHDHDDGSDINGVDDRDDNEDRQGRRARQVEEEEQEQDDEEETAKSRGLTDMTLDLLPTEVVTDLSEIASRMLRSGYESECMHAYIGVRKGVLEDSLGHEKLSFEEVQKVPWAALHIEISKWIRIMKVAFRCLFPSEKQLSDRIFSSQQAVSDLCFTDVAKPALTQLFNFGDAIAISRRSSEKLFKLLDMYECLNESIPLIETMFAGETSENLRFEALAILNRLGDAAWGTLVEFEDEVQHETSKTVLPSGAVHRTTRYVMNYMSFLCEYSDTMNQILSDRVGDSSNHHRDDPHRGPLSEVMLRFVENLERNIDGKSKLYKDLALANLFLMNNLHYIGQKVKGSEVVRKLVGDDWIRKNNGKLSQYHTNYRRIAWAKVLSCLKDEGITVSGGVVSNSSRNILKEKFKSFNAAFEENIRTQSNWFVPDPQLCSELQISVAGMLLPAYRSFHGRFKIHMDAVKHSERYVKYSPEDVETYLNDLFEGGPGSLNRRKSFPASGNIV